MSSPVKEKATMVELSINGKSVQVKSGTTILNAARGIGISIPTLCYMEKLKPIGSCRLCSVEVEGIDSSVMSCTTPVTQGMKVTTHSEKLEKYRQDMMKMILLNHPLDCPVCERSGECSLQNRTFELNVLGHDWKTNSHKKVPVVDWRLIRYDENLCIMCERCVKVCLEVQGVGAYKVDGNGYAAKINTVTGEPLDCDFCGQCISVCPVGALSSGIYFSGRSWEMKKTETVCSHCGVGCSFFANTKGENLVRITSNDFIGINNGNLCVRGRFGFEYAQGEERITAPQTKSGDGFLETGWDEALAEVSSRLKDYAEKFGSKSIVGIGSERSTNEDNYAFQKFFRDCLASGNIDNVSNMENASVCSGLFETYGGFPMAANFGDINESNLFVYIGADGSNESPVMGNMIRKALINNSAEVAIAYSKAGAFLPEPKIQLPYSYAGMNGFLLALLDATIKSGNPSAKADASFASSVADSASKVKLESALSQKVGELVQLIGQKGKPVYIVGKEAQTHPDAKAIIGNILNLAKLTAGKVFILREYSNTQGANDMGVAPNLLPGYGKESRTGLNSDGGIISLLESGDVKALVIMNEDVIGRYHNSARLRNAVSKAKYVVVIDQLTSETSAMADIILPSATTFESGGTMTSLEGRCQKVNASVKPAGSSRPAWRILSDLSNMIGKSIGCGSAEEIGKEISEKTSIYKNRGKDGLLDYSSLAGADWKPQLIQHENVKVEKGSYVLLPDLSLYSLGIYSDKCPSLKQVQGGHHENSDIKGAPLVDFNPADGAELGLSEGDSLNLKFAKGVWKCKARFNKGVKAGSIRVPYGMDNSRIEEVKITASGKAIPCVNLAVLKE